MQTNRVPVPDVAERSSFHSAFSQARGESRSLGVEVIRSKDPAPMESERLTYEVRTRNEAASGLLMPDVGTSSGGKAAGAGISRLGKQAYFRRIAINRR